jgi:hypothetical protein
MDDVNAIFAEINNAMLQIVSDNYVEVPLWHLYTNLNAVFDSNHGPRLYNEIVYVLMEHLESEVRHL